jgi:hypothetical protein
MRDVCILGRESLFGSGGRGLLWLGKDFDIKLEEVEKKDRSGGS